MPVEFVCELLLVPLRGGFLNHAVHEVDSTIGLKMGWLGQVVFHVVSTADTVKAVLTW
jgi:hypothetical protein